MPVTNAKLDAPLWHKVKPEFKEVNVTVSGEPYFAGKMIKSPLDQRGTTAHKNFLLRREFTLKAKPKSAWLQYTADDGATVYVNGIKISSANDWHYPQKDEVSPELKIGKNVLAFRYNNSRSAGGVLAELYVNYADGSAEKINTDGKFLAGIKEIEGWNKPGFDTAGWEKVIEQLPPPNAPWIVKMPYSDFSCPQTFVKSSVSPKSAQAGSKVKLYFEFNGKIPKFPATFKIALLKKSLELWNEEITLDKSSLKTLYNGAWAIDFNYELPHYLRNGNFTLRLESSAIFCQKGGMPDVQLTYHELKKCPGFEKKITSGVVTGANGPVMAIDGKPFFCVWAGVSNRRIDTTRRFGDAPVNVVTVHTTYNWFPACGKFCPEELDRMAERYRRDYGPDVMFMWDLTIKLPRDWATKYPSEICADETGAKSMEDYADYSFASKQALKDMKEAMIKALRYLESSPYANRIIGYRINGGHTIEWLGWDPRPNHIFDFSLAAKKGFKEFAQKHHPQLKDYTVPSLAQRRMLDNGEILWDPAKHLNVIAYHDFYSNSVVDMIIELCKTAKKELNFKKLVGTYYGYIVTLNASGAAQMRAHFALKRLLDSKVLDFLMSPQAYSVRNIGDTCGDMKPFASIAKNNIVSVIEDDTRTFNGPFLTYSNNYQMPTEKTTISVMRRNMAMAMARLQPIYYYALQTSMEFDFPEMGAEIATLRKLGEFCVDKRVRRNADTAIVFSEKANLEMPMLHRRGAANGYIIQIYQKDGSVKQFRAGNTVFTGESFNGNLTRYARAGAPTDYLLAEDLADNPGKYKLYIFVNCIRYDSKFLAAINKLKERDCTLLWVYAPGYSFGGKISVENMKKLTGFDFVKANGPLMPAVKLSDGRWLGTTSTRIAPMFAVKADKNITPLGKYEDDTIGYAFMKTGKARSIFCGAYQFDVPFLIELQKTSGVHIYSESSDPIEANDRIFTLHARFPGKKVVKLPRKTDVVDVMNKVLVAKGVDTFTFEAPLHSSWVFYYGDDANKLLEKLQ